MRCARRQRAAVFALFTSFVLTTVLAQRAVLDVELRPPRAALEHDHRGFPRAVDIHDFKSDGSLHVVERAHVVDLLGGISRVGEYYTSILVGGQRVRVQVDTGSSTLALPLAECERCLRTDLRYNMKLSKTGVARWVSCTDKRCRADMCATYKCPVCSARDACCSHVNRNACGFLLRYGDGSYARGGLVVDQMSWGDNITTEVVFGGILHDSPKFERPMVDGILGMAYEALACNPTCVEPPFQQMVKAGKLADSFAICVTGTGGKLILGGNDPDLAVEPMRYVPLALSRIPTFYTVNVSDVLQIGNRYMRLPNFKHGIVDSGTTLVVVSKTVFIMLMQYMRTYHCDIPGLCSAHSWFRPAACVRMPDKLVAKMPTLKFRLGPKSEFTLELPADDYMIRYHHSKYTNVRCVGIMAMGKMSHGTNVIFGNTMMQRYVTHYDRKNKRMGFARAKDGCGSAPDCGDLSTCVECASSNRCVYNFHTQRCRAADEHVNMLQYPACRGNGCFCTLGTQAGIVFGVGAGFGGTVLVLIAGVVAVVLYTTTVARRRQRENQYTLTADDEDFDADSNDFEEDPARQGRRPSAYDRVRDNDDGKDKALVDAS